VTLTSTQEDGGAPDNKNWAKRKKRHAKNVSRYSVHDETHGAAVENEIFHGFSSMLQNKSSYFVSRKSCK
jgi:hypothetical protein